MDKEFKNFMNDKYKNHNYNYYKTRDHAKEHAKSMAYGCLMFPIIMFLIVVFVVVIHCISVFTHIPNFILALLVLILVIFYGETIIDKIFKN